MSGLKVTEGGWELTPDPGLVLEDEVRISGVTGSQLRILDGEDEWELSFSRHSYRLTAKGRRLDVSEERLIQRRVTTIRALNSGVLHAEFDDGAKLMVEPALEYEAWELRRNGETMSFALPLGAEVGLAVYR